MRPENLLSQEGEVYFYPDFFSEGESRELFEILKETIQWKQEPIKIMGKEIMQPRLTAWYGEQKTYRYSGITMLPQIWTKELLMIKERIESEAGCNFTNVLLNYYRDGNDSMGWHKDNEKELGPNPVIGSVSFGVSRSFQFKNKSDQNLKEKVLLSSGSFLLMAGSTQHHWYHRVPKEPKILESRINLTFRRII